MRLSGRAESHGQPESRHLRHEQLPQHTGTEAVNSADGARGAREIVLSFYHREKKLVCS